MILSEWIVGTERNDLRRTQLSRLDNRSFSMWCGRRDLNPHSSRKRILSPLSFLCFQRAFRCSGILFPFQPEVAASFVGMDRRPWRG
jgi:hypothetical protein